jgi:hypothetical protein
MNTIDKYNELRPKIKNGAVALFRGHHALAKTIQWTDKAYYNHSALVFDAGGRLMVLDANAPGVAPEFLSERVSQYDDFCIINPLIDERTINNGVNLAIAKDLQLRFKYDFALLPKVLIAKKLGLPISHSLETNRSICSVFTGYHYGMLIGEYNWVNQALKADFFTPQDHLRYLSDKWEVLGK